MGNCNFCHRNTLNQQHSVVQVDVSPSKLTNQNTITSSILQPSPNIPNKNASHPNLPSALTEETTDMNLLNKKITTPVPSAVSLSQKGKNCKKQNSRFSALSNNITNITIYVFGPIKSGKTSLVHTFWNGLLHPFNPNEPYIHSEEEEVLEKKFHSNSKQYDILFKIPNRKETNIKKNESYTEYFLILFALNEVGQFEEAKEIYASGLNGYHHKKKNYENNLSYSNVIMLGTKSDLEKTVKEEDINVYVKEKGLMYFEMTLKDMKGLNLFLQMLVGFSEQNNLMLNKK